MRRRLAVILVTAPLLLFGGACGDDSGSGSGDGTESDSGPGY